MVIPFPKFDGATWLLGFGRNKPYMFTPEHEKNALFLVSQISSAITRERQSHLLSNLTDNKSKVH